MANLIPLSAKNKTKGFKSVHLHFFVCGENDFKKSFLFSLITYKLMKSNIQYEI